MKTATAASVSTVDEDDVEDSDEVDADGFEQYNMVVVPDGSLEPG